MQFDDSVFKGKISLRGYELLCITFNEHKNSLDDYPEKDLFKSKVHKFSFQASDGERSGVVEISMDTCTKDMLDLFNKLVDICMTYSTY